MRAPTSKKAETSDADLVVEALYQVAANPAAWDQLTDVLDPAGEDRAPPGAEAELERTPEIARQQSRPGEGLVPSQPAPGVGWVVVAASGRVLSSNLQALEILETLGGRVAANGALVFDHPDNTEAATRALDQARVSSHPMIVRLERPGLETPFFAYAACGDALPGFASASPPPALAERGSAALIFPATDAATRLWGAVRRSFGLTEAEVRLARQLRDGRSLQEAARDLGISINTVRNQLRAIFDKMGLQRQSELVVALADLGTLAGVIGAGAATVGPAPLAKAPPLMFVTLPDGRRLSYRQYGDPKGKMLLSFHEGLGSSLMPPETHARAMGAGLRILSVDRPGFGRSDPHPAFSFDGVAEDMVNFCNRLGLTHMRIGAHLSGAPFALHTARLLGERATEVFLCSGRSPRGAAEAGGPRNLLSEFRSRMSVNPWALQAFYSILRIRLSHRLTRSILLRTAAQSPGDQAYLAEHPELTDLVWGYVTEALGSENRGPMDELKIFRSGRVPSLDGLTAPVVVWHGEEDALAPMPELMAYLGEHVSEVRVFPGIGHLMGAKHWGEIIARAAR